MSKQQPVTYQEFKELPRKTKALLYLSAVLRVTIGLAFIFAFMAFMPNNVGGRIVGPVIVSILGTVFYIWYFKRQIRLVGKSIAPGLRAAEALILVIAMFLAIFAAAYVLVSANEPGSFTEPLDDFTAYYYSLTVLATVGFGDITPVSTVARSISMIQMALDIAIVGVAFRVMSSTAQRALNRGDAGKQAKSESEGA